MKPLTHQRAEVNISREIAREPIDYEFQEMHSPRAFGASRLARVKRNGHLFFHNGRFEISLRAAVRGKAPLACASPMKISPRGERISHRASDGGGGPKMPHWRGRPLRFQIRQLVVFAMMKKARKEQIVCLGRVLIKSLWLGNHSLPPTTCGLRRQKLRRSSDAVATSREGPRLPGLGPAVRHPRWGRGWAVAAVAKGRVLGLRRGAQRLLRASREPNRPGGAGNPFRTQDGLQA